MTADAITEATTKALAQLDGDCHDWQPRPCDTCRKISAVYGQPFGCDRVRAAAGRAEPRRKGWERADDR